MVNFEKFVLDNGLRVIIHKDTSTPFVVMDVLYNVGAKDENPEKTGFAHLFEHLMFGGSVNIPSYDKPLQKAGGENNAYTTNDYTNYYLTIPKKNIETGFWLESDRMLSLAFSDKALEVQRNVVTEEFRQSYLNQPYGDLWKLIRQMVYKVHPYRWQTIGMDISHIESATQDDVRNFYNKFYNPSNAILVVGGDVDTDEVYKLSQKWFGSIDKKFDYKRNLPVEPVQLIRREFTREADVPFDVITKVYRMCGRNDNDFFTANLISDILSGGESARLTRKLTRDNKIFSDVKAFVTGDIDPGMFVISGTLLPAVDIKMAELAIDKEIYEICNVAVDGREIDKMRNKIESEFSFSELDLMAKADNLAYHELLGDASLLNRYIDTYNSVGSDDILRYAQTIFKDANSSVLYYLAKDKNA